MSYLKGVAWSGVFLAVDVNDRIVKSPYWIASKFSES